ncbi:MAG: cytidine deaminase [Elusimicrobiota bacterium]|jgi:cytidine deaminase
MKIGSALRLLLSLSLTASALPAQAFASAVISVELPSPAAGGALFVPLSVSGDVVRSCLGMTGGSFSLPADKNLQAAVRAGTNILPAQEVLLSDDGSEALRPAAAVSLKPATAVLPSGIAFPAVHRSLSFMMGNLKVVSGRFESVVKPVSQGDFSTAGQGLISVFDGQSERSSAVADPAGSGSPALESLLPANPVYLSPEQVSRITQALGITKEQLLERLVETAKQFARPLISGAKYSVGAAGLGESGAVYLGGNLEFTGIAYNQSVHAERAVVLNALRHGEKGLVALALSAPPCGGCRQFLNELVSRERLRILVRGKPPVDFATLLKDPYGAKGTLLVPRPTNNLLPPERQAGGWRDLIETAFKAADTTYSPYDPSGVALRTKNGKIYSGGHIQILGAEPSLSPLQAALTHLVSEQGGFEDISEVVLVEWEGSKISEKRLVPLLLETIAPKARFKVVTVKKRSL